MTVASGHRVSFAHTIQDEITFDPLRHPRQDLDKLQYWALHTGSLPVTQRGPKAWSPRLDPAFAPNWLLNHLSGGLPIQTDLVRTKEAIAARNARELAEHVGYFDFSPEAAWPRDDHYQYGPTAAHTSEDTSIHIDRMPSHFARVDPGVRTLLADEPPATHTSIRDAPVDADDFEILGVDLDYPPPADAEDIDEEMLNIQL